MIFRKTFFLALAVALADISASTAEDGCCSHDYKKCVNWCGNPNDKDACLSCNHHDGVEWLENGAPDFKCAPRWMGCSANTGLNKWGNACCPGLECRPDANNWNACLPALSTPSPTEPPTASPTASPTDSPTESPKEGCCSHDYKFCINWCGNPNDKAACDRCNHHDGVEWLENGAPDFQCAKRWVGCSARTGLNKWGNECCPGLECRPDANNWHACLPSL